MFRCSPYSDDGLVSVPTVYGLYKEIPEEDLTI